MSLTPEERLKKKSALIKAYQNVFKGRDADLVLEDLRKRSYYDYPTYTSGMPDKLAEQNEGMRKLFLHIKGRINYNVDNLKLTMEDE